MKNPADYIVNTYSYTVLGSIESCVTSLSSAGFNAIELMTHPGHCWPAELNASDRRILAGTLERENMEIASISQPNIDLNLTSSYPEMRDHSLNRLLEVIQLGSDIGAPAIQVGPGKISPLLPDPRDTVRNRLFGALDRLIDAGQKAGVRILLENMPVSFLAKCADLRAMIDDYGSNSIGMTLDVANAEFVRDDYCEAIESCGTLLEMVHISDTGHDVYRHDPVGQGVVDFRKVGRALSASPWSGRPVIEVIGRSENPLNEIIDSIDRLEEMNWLASSAPAKDTEESKS